MQNTQTQNKEFRHRNVRTSALEYGLVQKPKSINELLSGGGARIGALKARSAHRAVTLEEVRLALPAHLADTVVSAGLEGTRLTLGVAGATWATRLRYLADRLRLQVSASLGREIQTVRIKVVPPA